MDIFKTLTEEHQFIHQFLDKLQMAQMKMEEGKKLPVEFLEKSIEFARTFADKYHHYKEEYLLFGLLAMKKKGELDGHIESLRYSHEQGRNLINHVAQALRSYQKGQEAANISILENLSAYISLIRAHIYKEDHVFFLLAAK
ncbi:MAG: hemerythrin domain-containing protein [Thermodesulfobacteriota bacterium]